MYSSFTENNDGVPSVATAGCNFPASRSRRSKIVESGGLPDVDNRILAADKQGKSGVKPALCRNGKCDRVSTSPNACLRLEPSSFEREGAGVYRW